MRPKPKVVDLTGTGRAGACVMRAGASVFFFPFLFFFLLFFFSFSSQPSKFLIIFLQHNTARSSARRASRTFG
jgi:hypothetical protein